METKINFTEFYERNLHRVRGWACQFGQGLSTDEREDVVNDVFLKAHSAIERGTFDGDNEDAWLSFIAKNHCIDLYRKQMVRKEFSIDDDEMYFDHLEDGYDDMQIAMEKRETTDILYKMVERLSTTQKSVLNRALLGHSMKDMAETDGLSIMTIIGQKRYAVQKLKKMVKEFDIEVTW